MLGLDTSVLRGMSLPYVIMSSLSFDVDSTGNDRIKIRIIKEPLIADFIGALRLVGD